MDCDRRHIPQLAAKSFHDVRERSADFAGANDATTLRL
jgi:hypothetical protein